ncbi:MAG: polysaccharide pyruvyl transferase family protein [Methanosarcinaceae archaeon]
MKKVTVFGSYNKNSIGDKAILLGLLDLLFKEAKTDISVRVVCFDVDAINSEIKDYKWSKNIEVMSYFDKRITVASTKFALIKMRLEKIIKILYRRLTPPSINEFSESIPDLVVDSECLIIGGGNLLMDLFPRWPIRLYRIFYQFYQKGLPVMILGVGAFPIRTMAGKFLLKKIVTQSDLVYVRDERSQTYIQNSWHTPIGCHPDFALSLPVNAVYMKPAKESPLIISVNIGSIYEENNPVIDKRKSIELAKNVAEAILVYYHKSQEEISFYLYDTNYPTDRHGAIRLTDFLVAGGVAKELIQYDDRVLSVATLLKKISLSKFAITTRLHAGILALKMGIPVIAIAYQPKVVSVLEYIGVPDCVIDIEDINSDLIKKIYDVDKNPMNFKLTNKQRQNLDNTNRNLIQTIFQKPNS